MERISRAGFTAEIICDADSLPLVWHCIVQGDGSREVLFWAQEETWAGALHAADEALVDLGQASENHDRVNNDASILEKKFMTLHETTQRLRSRR